MIDAIGRASFYGAVAGLLLAIVPIWVEVLR